MTSEPLDATAYAIRSAAGTDDEALRRLKRLRPWYVAFLRPCLPKARTARILDVPCGSGNLLYALTSLGYTNVTGVDSDRGQVEQAIRLGLPAQTGDALGLVRGAPTASVDRIFSLDFLEHVPPSDALDFCRLARTALIDGGALVCRTPSADGPFGSHDRHNDVTHKWGMTANTAVQLMTMAGFSRDRVRVLDEAPVPYSWPNVLRRGAFVATTRLLGAWLEIAGIGAPRIWTRSMWIIAIR